MKKVIISVIAASTLLLSACGTSSYYASSGYQDGIYYRASKEDKAHIELARKEVDDLIYKTRQDARSYADTIHYVVAATPTSTDSAGSTYIQITNIDIDLPWENSYYSYWDNPWYRYGYYGPGYYGWGYTWDPWYYGPSHPWGPSPYYGWSFGWGFGWDPWYGPSWSFYYGGYWGGYWGYPWDPYWGGWMYPPHHGHSSPTGYYYGKRDEHRGGSMASGVRHQGGVRGDNKPRDEHFAHQGSNPKPNIVRGREVPKGAQNAVRTGGRMETSPINGSIQRKDNFGESYVFNRNNTANSTSFRGRKADTKENQRAVSGNFRRSAQTNDHATPDFSRSNNSFRRTESDNSWGKTISNYRNDNRSTSVRSSGSSSFNRSSGSTGGGSVRSSGGSGGGRTGGSSGPRR